MEEKEKLLQALNAILNAVPINKYILTSFLEGDSEKVQSMETNNNMINIVFSEEFGYWGVNPIGIINTIMNILIGDSLVFISSEDGILREVTFKSKLEKRDLK